VAARTDGRCAGEFTLDAMGVAPRANTPERLV